MRASPPWENIRDWMGWRACASVWHMSCSPMAPTPTSVYTAQHRPLIEFSLQFQLSVLFWRRSLKGKARKQRTERLCTAASPTMRQPAWNLLSKDLRSSTHPRLLSSISWPSSTPRAAAEHADISCDKTRHALRELRAQMKGEKTVHRLARASWHPANVDSSH